MTNGIRRFGLVLSVVLVGLGCNRPQTSQEHNAATSAPLTAATPATRAPTTGKVTRVVFVGKEQPCDCTKARLESGWSALQSALGTPPKVPVERLQLDTEPDQVEPFQRQKPAMTLPALYFLDANDSVVELLQGEVTREQVATALAK